MYLHKNTSSYCTKYKIMKKQADHICTGTPHTYTCIHAPKTRIIHISYFTHKQNPLSNNDGRLLCDHLSASAWRVSFRFSLFRFVFVSRALSTSNPGESPTSTLHEEYMQYTRENDISRSLKSWLSTYIKRTNSQLACRFVTIPQGSRWV